MAKQSFSVGQVLTAAQMTSLQQTAMLGGAASAKTASYTLVAADAGTAISMNNASATTITVNTGLFAAGDTVHITNLGSGVCTITAGTATVNSSASLALAQYESGFLDFTSTGAAIFVKGAGAAAASGGMTLLSTTSLSGATVTISAINQTYQNLQIILYGTSNTGASLYSPRIAPNGTTNICSYNGLAKSTAKEFENDYLWCNLDSNVSLTNVENVFLINIYDYTNTSENKAFDLRAGWYDNANYRASNGGGYIRTTSAITSLVLSYGAGNFDAGTCEIWGIK